MAESMPPQQRTSDETQNHNQRPLHILVIDEVNIGTSVYKPVTYTDFVDPAEARILLITSKDAPSASDRAHCLALVELEMPTSNGMVELCAQRLHRTHHIDIIYTKQEDLILRVAHLRQLLGISTGMYRHDALLFRDKFVMKQRARDGGVPVPAFTRVYSPADLIAFTELHSLPMVIKPILGSASAGVRVIHNIPDFETYLASEFYSRIDDKGMVMDYSGDLIAEAYLDGRAMYHVNGFAEHGEIVAVWPFAYVHTNLGFTRGEAYGNVLIPETDARWRGLVAATRKLLGVLPRTQRLVFHLELFAPEGTENGDVDHDDTAYVLCEIAARRPGGSIALLIDEASGGGGYFPENEFRFNVGLAPRTHGRESIPPTASIGDLMIPKKVGRLTALPDPAACPIPGIQCILMGKIGTSYNGFSLNTLNTCARLVASGPHFSSAKQVEKALEDANRWFDQNTIYEAVAKS